MLSDVAAVEAEESDLSMVRESPHDGSSRSSDMAADFQGCEIVVKGDRDRKCRSRVGSCRDRRRMCSIRDFLCGFNNLFFSPFVCDDERKGVRKRQLGLVVEDVRGLGRPNGE